MPDAGWHVDGGFSRRQLPPGWKLRLYGRQDACRYGKRGHGGGWGMPGHGFYADYGIGA